MSSMDTKVKVNHMAKCVALFFVRIGLTFPALSGTQPLGNGRGNELLLKTWELVLGPG